MRIKDVKTIITKESKKLKKSTLHLAEIIEYKDEKFQINYNKILKHRDSLIKI